LSCCEQYPGSTQDFERIIEITKLSMKYFFIVQGEGMGHTTQSLALRSMLERNGHSITDVFLGTNFFRHKNKLFSAFQHNVFFSPVFLSRRDKKGINLTTTFLFNILLSPIYLIEIFRLAIRIRSSDTDALVVFYDIIGQMSAFLSFSGKPVYSVSHHFFFSHPAFKWPVDRKSERTLLKIHSWLASLGAKKILALSFTEENHIPEENLFVVPPLLRTEILESLPAPGDHVHIYLLHQGFLNLIIKMARNNPQREFRIFMHKIDTKIEPLSNVHVSGISGDEFLKSIRNSAAVICTAGFETLAEAVYLNKPLAVVPSEGHFEQYCNAIDSLRAGVANVIHVGTSGELPAYADNPGYTNFKKWTDGAEEIFLKCLTE